MTLPLIILGTLALVAGALNATAFFHFIPLDHFLEGSIGKFDNIKPRPNSEQLEYVLLLPGIFAFILGTAWASWVYLFEKGRPAQRFVQRYPKFYNLVFEKWRIDELYSETIVGTLELIADICVWFDKWIVDGILSRVTSFIVALLGSCMRLFQTGRVQTYAAFIVLGLGGTSWFMMTPHAEAAIATDHETGKYKLTAEPGIGYGYRWDSNGDGKFETQGFGDQQTVDVELARTERRTVTLQVRDVFGREATRKFKLERPAEELSGLRNIHNNPDGVPRPNNPSAPAQNGANAPGRAVQPGQLQ